MREEQSNYYSKTRRWVVAALVLQNSLGTLVGRATRTTTSPSSPDDLYSVNHFLIISESFKFTLSLLLELYFRGSISEFMDGIRMHILKNPIDAIKGSLVLSLLYFASNAMTYVALTYLSAPVFQVLLQTKLVTTAIMSVLVFDRSYSTQQWSSLIMLSIGLATVVIFQEENTGIGAMQASNSVRGIVAVLSVCIISSSAGVYFEGVLKHDQKRRNKSPSLWLRNVMLSFFSILVALSQILYDQFSPQQGEFVPKPFLHGFTPLVWLQVLLFSCGGILASAVIKYSDNVVKGIATSISMVLTSILSVVLLGTKLSFPIVVGSGIVLLAVFDFFDSRRINLGMRCVVARINLGMRCVVALIVVVAVSELSKETESIMGTPTLIIKEEMSVNASQVMDDLVQSASSKVSLNTLRFVQGAVKERNFHEGTHILYDIRTKLGSRPAKYLEIGSYTGVSASLMLKHPFPTQVTAVDPCALRKTHFNGHLSQEETIKKNLAFAESKGCSFLSPWNLVVGYSPEALPKGETFDIIFVDGDHSTSGVWSDYNHTLNLLRPGGFMVFDDYLDSKFSPEVKPAVDSIARVTDLVPIGAPPDIHGVHAHLGLKALNEYIFQKRGSFKPKPQPVPSTPVLCVVVATYKREDGSSPGKLEALWKTLLAQSYKNWKLYLTGDKYEDEQEWRTLSFFNESQVSIYNLPEPGERLKLSGTKLWNNAGATAMNEGIRRALSDGNEWIVRFDDDDLWDADHLENIHAGIRTGATFVTTSCQFVFNGYLPKETTEWRSHMRHDVPPRPCGVIQSSIAFNAGILKSRYLRYPELPADAYMWSRIVYEDNFFPVFVPGMSCNHLSEQSSQNQVRLVRKNMMHDIYPPTGWHRDNGTERFNDYNTLATHSFEPNISRHCQFVVGPEQGHPDFHQVAKHEVPYHIRIVPMFKDMSVWRKK